MSPRPRLLILITRADLGGAQTYVSLLVPALTETFDVIVAAHGSGGLRAAVDAGGARFVPLKHVRRAVHPVHDLLGLAELVRLCRRERPVIVHANSSKAGVLGRLAASIAKVPVRMFTVHGWAFAAYNGLASRLYLGADRLVRPLTTTIVCVAENERQTGIAARTCTAEQTVVIHNGVEVDGRPRSRVDARTPPELLSVGRFDYPKDFQTLLEALAGVEHPYRARIVGDGPERDALEATIARLGLEDRVELIGERRDVAELLAESDLFVLSSRSEGLPMSILEAMATGLPVIASDVGGVSEAVEDGVTGLLVPPSDPAALAAGLGALLADPAERRRLGEAGRARAEERFGLARFRQAHLDLYRRELARVGTPGQDSRDG
ncbi:MAG: glycosyltransferase family 4 protein [Actinomycetota bacterium]|nr:glycosyltransferase family 4 protein [Actinomycetota bacterium]